MWSFTIGSAEADPLAIDKRKLTEIYFKFVKEKGELKYYNPDIHYGAFAIPNFVYRDI